MSEHKSGWELEGITPPTVDYQRWAREWTQRYGRASDERPEPDVFAEARREGETRAETKARLFEEHKAIQPVTYDDVVRLMSMLENEPYRDSWGYTPAEIKRDGIALHPLTQRPQAYHRRPMEFMQGMGGGKPYNRKSGIHFAQRYSMGAGHQPGIYVGILHKTPRLMAEHEARESQAREACRLLSLDPLGDKLRA